MVTFSICTLIQISFHKHLYKKICAWAHWVQGWVMLPRGQAYGAWLNTYSPCHLVALVGLEPTRTKCPTDFKSVVSTYSTTVPYLTYFYIVSYFFNFVKNFFTLITLDIINGNHFLAGGLLRSTLITIRKTHIIFPFHLFILLSVQFQSHASHQGFIFPFLCHYCLIGF